MTELGNRRHSLLRCRIPGTAEIRLNNMTMPSLQISTAKFSISCSITDEITSVFGDLLRG